MRFDNTRHPLYCGIDLHARAMSVCILTQAGETLRHRHRQTTPAALLTVMAPYRPAIVVAVACMFTWDWLADLCAEAAIPFGLGHALSMQAIHGGKATHDQSDAHTMAVLLRGGLLPQAYVSPAARRATRALLRRRMPLAHKRGARLAHVHHTTRQDHVPALGTNLAYQANRDGVAARCADPAGPTSMEGDLALIAYEDALKRRDVERTIVPTATQHDAHTLALRQTVPGIGTRLSLVLRGRHPAHRPRPSGAGVGLLVPSGHVGQGIPRQTLGDCRGQHGQGPSHMDVFRSGRLLPAGASRRPDMPGELGAKTRPRQGMNHLRSSMSAGRLCHVQATGRLCSAKMLARRREGRRGA